MPSPFPGMDPYLEMSGRWPTFHTPFMVTISEVLNRVLPEQYVAVIEERLLLGEMGEGEGEGSRPGAGTPVIPDITVRRDDQASAGPLGAGAATASTIAPQPVPQHSDWIDLPTQKYVDVLEGGRVVTSVEVLSPTNKRPGRDREAYLDKRRSGLFRDINLVEIDLLLRGRPIPLGGEMPEGDYFALVTDVQRVNVCNVYAWSIRDPLPTIAVPLRPRDGSVPLDLAEAFRLTFDRGRHGRFLPYDRPPPRQLSDADRRWAAELAATVRR